MHIIQCTDLAAQEKETTLRTNLLNDLDNYPSNPTVMQSIVALLTYIIRDTPIQAAQQHMTALTEQLAVEASEFLKARLVHQ